MKYSDILVGCIYNVIFDPVESCEFDGKHLAIVLKKNLDKRTCIVMPMTTSANGDRDNKKNLGRISSLPTSLNGSDTYAVFNQVRTVNAGRFIRLKEGPDPIQCPVEPAIFADVLSLAIGEIMYSATRDQKITILKNAYEAECIIKAKDLAYTIIRMRRQEPIPEEKISELKAAIRETLGGVPYTLEAHEISMGIQGIFEECNS